MPWAPPVGHGTSQIMRDPSRPAAPADRVVPKFLLSYEEAAWSLGICERTLRNMISQGQLNPVKLGARTLFDPCDLRDLVKDKKKTIHQTSARDGPESVQSQ